MLTSGPPLPGSPATSSKRQTVNSRRGFGGAGGRARLSICSARRVVRDGPQHARVDAVLVLLAAGAVVLEVAAGLAGDGAAVTRWPGQPRPASGLRRLPATDTRTNRSGFKIASSADRAKVSAPARRLVLDLDQFQRPVAVGFTQTQRQLGRGQGVREVQRRRALRPVGR